MFETVDTKIVRTKKRQFEHFWVVRWRRIQQQIEAKKRKIDRGTKGALGNMLKIIKAPFPKEEI